MEFQSYLSQRYQGHKSFLENIIFPIFGEDNFESTWDVELLDSEELINQAGRTGIRSILRCGTINLDLTPIEVFDITVSDRILMDKNRVGVQAVIRRVMDTFSGAFMLIHYDNDVKWDWRFTFCQLRDKQEFTDSKRYTFLLGPNQSCRTAAQNFQKLADLHEEITIKDIVSAFDVEALSKDFFRGYKDHYERFVEYITGKRFVKEGGKFVERSSHEPHAKYYPLFGRDDKAVRDYTKLLLARIVFLHFLQKKGWLGVPKGGKWGEGDEQFMLHLYQNASAAQKEDFLGKVLEPLFFDALNGDRTDRKDLFDTTVLGVVRVPYLNGGLFSKEKVDAMDIKYPKEFFEKFLDFLYQYNFTIDENDPNEAQVGIDPEMLGKIFENLLEDNKDKGAFYTPKEIVQYMCQESLVAYLLTKTGYDEDLLRAFVKNPDVFVEKFSEGQKEKLLDAILNVKICDPAIGSGAFPIGLLNELVHCKEAIFGDEKGRAEIKKEIIRDNIYGVDIEKGAVDIARLRFWLSLIVDEDEPLPLPNLDYKIMQGNSLLESYNGADLSHIADTAAYGDMFGGGEAEILKDNLSKLLKKYFGESVSDKKAALKESIKKTIIEILDIAAVEIPTDIDLAENNQFFLWHTWYNEVFANGGGFDICIGNPPYIQLQVDGGKLGKLYQNCGFQSFTSTGDIYCLFYEHGNRILKPNGHLCFITSNKWMRAAYGECLRSFLANNVNPVQLIDFAGLKIFESATVDTNILLFEKAEYKHETLCVIAEKEKPDIIKNLSVFVQQQGSYCDFSGSESWVILSQIEQSIKHKIESVGIPLKDWDLQINYGIKTGFNDAFIITTEKRDKILANCSTKDERLRTAELIRPILRGRDIKRYGYNWANIWIINTHNGLKGRVPRIDIADYPAIKAHLDQYWTKIRDRADQGDTPYNLRNCAYLEDFSKQKIIYREIGLEMDACIIPEGWFVNNKLYLITGNKLEYLIALLNSKVFNKILLTSANLTGGKGVDFMEKLRLPQNDDLCSELTAIYNSRDCNASYEKMIDQKLYEFYGLSSKEIHFLEANLDE